MKKHLTNLVGLFALSVYALPATAELYTASLADNLGPLNGGSLTYSVTSPGSSLSNAGTLSFDLLGYLSVDGLNCCTDTFSLTVNNNLLFSGGFDMGGGGGGFVNFNDPNVSIVSTTSYGFGIGGLTQFNVNFSLLSGLNTFVFDYGSMQGLGDEGWGLRSAQILADVTSVPIPSAMLLFGTGLIGLLGTQFKTKRLFHLLFRYLHGRS